jgi:hypothetical protein
MQEKSLPQNPANSQGGKWEANMVMFVPEGEWNHTGEKPATGSTYTKCGGILFPPH